VNLHFVRDVMEQVILEIIYRQERDQEYFAWIYGGEIMPDQPDDFLQ